MIMARDEHWTIDKRIPAAFLFALLAQVAGFVWYASRLDARIGFLEVRQMEARERLTTVDREAKDVFGRLVRLEEKQSATLEILHRIERQLSPSRAP